MAPGQKDRSLCNKRADVTQQHDRRGYRHMEPASGRPLYSSSDHELSILRDWQLGSYGSDGIGRQRTLGPSYMGTSDWKRSSTRNKPPPDFSEIPHRPRGSNKPLHGSIDAKKERQRPATAGQVVAGNLLVDSRPLRNTNFILEQEEAPRTAAPVKFFNKAWVEAHSTSMTEKLEGSLKEREVSHIISSERIGKIMLVHKSSGKDSWIDDSARVGPAWR